eukprot:m.63456 g.63456  ORF g.63456 m.63456 type:complete len:85 (-) comp13969_c0_seq12:1655-1909(-)
MVQGTMPMPEGSVPWAIKIKGQQTNGGGVESISFVNLTAGPIVPTPQQPLLSVSVDYMNYGTSLCSPCANPFTAAPDTCACMDR